jgi:hypothetical protein
MMAAALPLLWNCDDSSWKIGWKASYSVVDWFSYRINFIMLCPACIFIAFAPPHKNMFACYYWFYVIGFMSLVIRYYFVDVYFLETPDGYFFQVDIDVNKSSHLHMPRWICLNHDKKWMRITLLVCWYSFRILTNKHNEDIIFYGDNHILIKFVSHQSLI